MADLVFSAFFSAVLEQVASVAMEKLGPYVETTLEIKKLERSLLQIRGVLTDAAQKEITDQSVKRWLNGLHHLAYDIDDVLDEISTEATRRELTDESETHTSKVIKFFSDPFSKHASWTRVMKGKIDDITTKLQDLVEEKTTLGLTVKAETKSKNINRRLQTSMVHVSSIVGRQVEKEALVQQLLLLADEPCDQNFSIIPIVGMGGVGKTTLARLLYDEKQVKDHFKLKAWVCVSDEFDSFGISKVIFQSVTGVHKEFRDLNLLQVDLRNHLREKRFLLVLDDIWSESYEDWETLVGPFHACAPGSKIIITTRKEQLIRQLGYDHPTKLHTLSHDDALSLFALHALGVDKFDSHLSLKLHGEAIVRKCDGLPLALTTLGRSLRTKQDEDSWREVLESELWRSTEGVIVPALRISYDDLSARLKQLFAYCSLFPKDFLFDKEELILLWMAQGFLHESNPSHLTEERLGHEYFDELLSRSFFQRAPNNESLFVMHDLMNDLATYVAGEFFLRFGNETRKNSMEENLEKYRHMSYVRERYGTYKTFQVFTRAKSLRTFLATPVREVDSQQRFYLSNKLVFDLLPKFPLLRVLFLSDFQISEVPESVGTLRHLRYLNLSRTKIAHLPENVCALYNLQSLIVFGCDRLTKLPNSFLKLKSLRHLDIRNTPLLDEMPLGIGELNGLQTLSKIIIGGERRFGIGKLKDLKNLCGKTSIVGLDKVQNTIDARVASFSQKRLSELEVVWSDMWDGSRNEMLEKEVLNELKPRNDKLIKLKIRSYGGLEFPTWVGDPSFNLLKHVSISGCRRCTSLPPLGQLPLLKELFIKGLHGMEVVGLELFGSGLAFPSLEILSFEDMRGWKKWSTNTGIVFPCLKKLNIEDCPNLVEVSLEALPSLNALNVINCDSGVLRRLVGIASAVTKLELKGISRLNDVVWRGVIECLGAVEELKIRGCNEIRYLWESEAFASKVLVKLRELEVFNCDNLVRLGEREEEDNCRSNLLTSLRILYVFQCSSVTAISLPAGAQKLKSLKIHECNELLEREWGGQKSNNNTSSMPMLEYVRLFGWRNLKSIIELKYLVHLTTLMIMSCEGLESFPDNELSNMISLKELLITNCPNMDASFPSGIWPPKLHTLALGNFKKPISEWGPQNFPTSLVVLYLTSEDGVISSSEFSHLLPSSLNYLEINKFENLESFSMGLQHLTSLKKLTFTKCPSMMVLSETLLPSLLSLRIWNSCPILKERCSKSGCYWPLISDIPCIDIRPPQP